MTVTGYKRIDELTAFSGTPATSMLLHGEQSSLDYGVTIAQIQDALSGVGADQIADGSVSDAEYQRLNGVTSAIQTQIDAKQPLDATLTALAAVDTNAGVVCQTGTDAFAKRTLTAGANISITNGNGASGNPTIAFSGPLSVANGGQDTNPKINWGGVNFASGFYLDGNALTGVADGKKGMFLARVRFANAASATEDIFGLTSAKFRVNRGSSGAITVSAKNSGGTTILDVATSTNFCSAAGDYEIRASWDLSTASVTLSVTKISDMTVSAQTLTTATDDNIDYTSTEYAVGAQTNGNTPLSGDIYSLFFDTSASYTDVSAESFRRKTTDIIGTPRYMGASGELITGTPPDLFLAYSSSDNWDKNKGTKTSTSFVRQGSIADATTVLNGQFMPRTAQTITAAATTGAQTIDKRAGSVNFAAAATTLVVTNSYVRSDSIVLAQMMTNDATATGIKSVEVSSSGGSFTIRLMAAATAETKVAFFVVS